MRKGDMRKAAIIDTAESLFYSKGYENTSIQDVLDALNLSKGGFYHHFESKLSLLDAICEKRVDAYAQACLKQIEDMKLSGINKLNCALSYSSYLKDASIKFISIMLKVAYKDGAVMLRDHMKMASVNLLSPIVNAAIAEGVAESIFYAKYTDELGAILLNLSNSLTDAVSLLSVNESDILERNRKIRAKTDAYRYAMETLLNAPHDSLILFDVDVTQITNEALMLMEKLEEENKYAM